MHHRLQLGMRENPACDRRHGSRPMVRASLHSRFLETDATTARTAGGSPLCGPEIPMPPRMPVYTNLPREEQKRVGRHERNEDNLPDDLKLTVTLLAWT